MHAGVQAHAQVCRGRALTKMPSQEAEAKSAELSCAKPNPWSGTTIGGSASRKASVMTVPCTDPVPYFMLNSLPVSYNQAECSCQCQDLNNKLPCLFLALPSLVL